MQTIEKHTTGFVTSPDGTKIGYRQMGNGPAVLLIHGGLMTSQNFIKLATFLSDSFTVYIPDRRGRGMSGAHGNNYSLAKECEDMNALVAKTGATKIFGLSSGAIVALHLAKINPAIHHLAIYEPPFIIGKSNPAAWVTRYEKELQEGKLAGAMVSIIKGTADKFSMGLLPRFLLVALIKMALKAEAKKETDAVKIKDLIPTMHYDAILVKDRENKIDEYKSVRANILLMGGTRSHKTLLVPLDRLEQILPKAKRIMLKRVGHIAADNSGKPQLVANALLDFFPSKTLS